MITSDSNGLSVNINIQLSNASAFRKTINVAKAFADNDRVSTGPRKISSGNAMMFEDVVEISPRARQLLSKEE